MLEIADRLMGRGVLLGVFLLLDLHRENGVDVRLSSGIERIEGTEAVSGVTAQSGELLPRIRGHRYRYYPGYRSCRGRGSRC